MLNVLDSNLSLVERWSKRVWTRQFREQGPVYPVTMLSWLVLCLIAAFTKNKRFHAGFAIVFLVWNLVFAGMMLITAQAALGAKSLYP